MCLLVEEGLGTLQAADISIPSALHGKEYSSVHTCEHCEH